MKKLQNNSTTPEQSKRLLELGVPVWTADCYLNSWEQIQLRILNDLDKDFFEKYSYIPSWSVGRLIEIMKICNHLDDVDQVFCELAYSKKNLVELIVRLMEENKEITDFSKLEEYGMGSSNN